MLKYLKTIQHLKTNSFMNKQHNYTINLQWTGNTGSGTRAYTAYSRHHLVFAENKSEIECSSDPSFNGDKSRYNPEELLVASLSSCHMLWYLHLCSVNGIVVTHYVDKAKGIMMETENDGGHFKEVILYPQVTVADASMIKKANFLHEEAHRLCFIANSCNFPVMHVANIILKNTEE